MLDRSTNIQTEAAFGAPVALATARQRIPDILAVAVVLFFAVATVAVDATEGMKYVYNTTVPSPLSNYMQGDTFFIVLVLIFFYRPFNPPRG